MNTVTIANDQLRLEMLPFGATVRRLEVATPTGWRNVVLGHRELSAYRSDHGALGASVGRFANRIDHARFHLDGRLYLLDANEPPNLVHGGTVGFGQREWAVVGSGSDWVEFALTSIDGDQGFPGDVQVRARFAVSANSAAVTYTATTTAPTVINLTTHPYFNLDGEGAGLVGEHQLTIDADAFTPTRSDGVPTGEIRPVAGTALDFRTGQRIEPARQRALVEGLTRNDGFDHNFVLSGEGIRPVATLIATSGLRLRVYSDQPGLQIYTGDHFRGEIGTSGQPYQVQAGLALETQGFPDAPNQPDFPSTVLRPGQVYQAYTRWQFDQLAS